MAAGQAMSSPNSGTMQQALNSLYASQMKGGNGQPRGHGAHNYFESGGQSHNKSFESPEDQEKMNGQGNGAFDLSMLNSQLIELIRQDPSQLEQILKCNWNFLAEMFNGNTICD